MFKRITLTTVLFLFSLFLSELLAQKVYSYESFPDDPLEARIYTLDNGLKVYMSVFREQPRIQTYVAVKVGSKYDPAEATGLAHYFEHLMFKGTSTFGTIDWKKEKPLLDEIEDLYEMYSTTRDEAERALIYRQIDSISYIASTYAIPNEYDRLMSAIGSKGTNAGTSNDYTYYVEDIPMNQLENWAKVQGLRFKDPILRLFHTELETVYEEFNMSQTNDKRLVALAMHQALYPNHPYAKQTTLGEPEHLKNPSIKKIRQFYEQYYVPNNMAVVLAGDFDPDEAIRIVDTYFSGLKPSPVPGFRVDPPPSISQPVAIEVFCPASEYIQLGWRFEGAASSQIPYLEMVSNILGNGRAGLVDQNINKPQAARGASATTSVLEDYSILNMFGRPKAGQTPDEVKQLLLEQVEILKSGDWPDWMMEAAVNHIRLNQRQRAESISRRARDMAMSFLQGVPYEQTIGFVNRLEQIQKDEIIAFAKEHLRQDNYALVHKKQLKEIEVETVEKPPITPIHINRDSKSDLLKAILESEAPSIEPVFMDYRQDLVRVYLPNGSELLYVQDKSSPTFSLTFNWELGWYQNRYLPFISHYFNAAGTETMTAADVSIQYYILAGGYSFRSTGNNTRLSLRGLKENLVPGMELMQDVIWKTEENDSALRQIIINEKTSRRNSRTNQQALLSALENYSTYGPDNPSTFSLSNEEMDEMTPAQLIGILHELHSFDHSIHYNGPHNLQEVIALVMKYHQAPDTLEPVPDKIRFEALDTNEEKVYFAHYDASQSYCQTVSKGAPYDPELSPVVTLFNRYFAGGMNAIVFQELREKRGLAYMATGRFNEPIRTDENYMITSLIATQNDKVVEAFSAFNELFDDLPLSQPAFTLAMEQTVSNLRTERFLPGSIITNFRRDRRMGNTVDSRRMIYERVPVITLEDLETFSRKHISGKPKTYIILGNENIVDFEEVERQFGSVTRLTTDELFNH